MRSWFILYKGMNFSGFHYDNWLFLFTFVHQNNKSKFLQDMLLTIEDKELLKKKGISESQIEAQLKDFKVILL